MKIGGAVAVLGIGMVASQIGTPHLLTTYECDTDGRKCIRYTQCFYIGMQGWRKFYPGVAPAGGCPGVKFFTLAEERARGCLRGYGLGVWRNALAKYSL
jgi:hypothetical protein